MHSIPAPTLVLPREEWPDADFDLPDGVPLHTPSDKDDEDWDLEMDLGQTGGAKVDFPATRPAADLQTQPSSSALDINIRPPLHLSEEDDDEEGVSTIKASALSTITQAKVAAKPVVETIEEDFEDAFALPSDLTQLSLAPTSLNHRSSKASLEWGDKENSSSSQSSDAYSTLGFADASPSSNSTSCPSLPDTETEEEEEELEGLVLPTALFESGQSARQLQKILETKKKAPLIKPALKSKSLDADEDFEMGLVINDDVDLSPSRLVHNTQHKPQRPFNRSHSIPSQRPSALRPPSRAKLDRSKSPANPPTSSAKQLQKLRLSPSPPLQPPTRSQTFQTLGSSFPVPSTSSAQNFLSPKPGSLRGQKSHSGLKPPTPPSSTRKLARKASMSSLLETSNAQALGSSSMTDQAMKARYEEPTAASRAKSHKSSTSRIHDFKVPPTRPHTPSSNPAALRLTMPTQSRFKTRPALSQVFGGSSEDSKSQLNPRAPSPLPPRPPSSSSSRAAGPSHNAPISPVVPKLLRRPKRLRTYGDGTELDGFEDLPTDRDKEVRYRVQPKGYGNRIPGSTFSSKAADKEKAVEKGAPKKKTRRDSSTAHDTVPPPSNSLRRSSTRNDFHSPPPTSPESLPRKKKSSPSSSTTKRKPTLIRNLGGSNVPKVVGEMKWNPQTLRWEGNDQVLRDFDVAVGTSVRPALITHLSGSSAGSPMSSLASGPRIVGNMIFDPVKMCWISTLPPEEDEPDVFANLADDEDDSDAWETKGGTIRANILRSADGNPASKSLNSRTSSSSNSHSRAISDSGSDRGSRASMVVGDVDDDFIESCRRAEERHRLEMKGWKTSLSKRDTSLASDRSYLYEIRALATRKY